MIPVVNFVYPLFVNKDLLTKAGVTEVPGTRTEFLDAAKKISASGGNVKGWAPARHRRAQRHPERRDVLAGRPAAAC